MSSPTPGNAEPQLGINIIPHCKKLPPLNPTGLCKKIKQKPAFKKLKSDDAFSWRIMATIIKAE